MADTILAYISEIRFPQLQDLCRNTTNINFHYITNSLKIIDQLSLLKNYFSLNSKNPAFCQFLVQKIFSRNPALSRKTSYGLLAPYQNLEKTNDTIPRKRPHRWKDGRKDGQTLFYKTLPATARGPKIIVEEEADDRLFRFII